MTKNFLIYKRILWTTWWLLLVLIFYNLVVPSGQITYFWHPQAANNRVGKLSPENRVDLPTSDGQRLRGTPVYWAVNTSRPFNNLKVTVTYEPGLEDNLDIGLLRDGKLWRYERQSVYNRYLESVLNSKDWQIISDGDLIVAQRKAVYKTVADFLAKPPKATETVAYNYTWKQPVKVSWYKADNKQRNVNAGLVGSWNAYTYIKDEVLRLRLEVVDYNKNKDNDKGELIVWAPDGSKVGSYELVDDRGGEESGEPKSAGTLSVDVPNLKEGLYKLEWRAGRDLEVRDLTTYQKLWSIVGKVEVARSVGLWLQGDTAALSTYNPTSLSSVAVGSTTINLGDTYKQFREPVDCAGACAVKLPAETLLGTNGRLAFWADGLIGPEIRELTEEVVDNKKINFLIARYNRPLDKDGQKTVTVNFSLQGAYREKGNYGLMLAMPETVVEGPKIKEIKMEFQGSGLKTLWQKIWSK